MNVAVSEFVDVLLVSLRNIFLRLQGAGLVKHPTLGGSSSVQTRKKPMRRLQPFPRMATNPSDPVFALEGSLMKML